MTDPYIIFEK